MKFKWWFRLLKPLLNERGEIGGQEASLETTDEVSKTEYEEIVVDDDLNKEETPAGGEEKDAEKPDFSLELNELKSKVEKLETDKQNLNKALHKTRQKAKETKTEEVLSKDQLRQILEENAGDPDTMLRVLEYQAKQFGKEAAQTVVTDDKLNSIQKEADEMLIEMYPSLAEESSAMRKAVDETKSNYGIANHQFGDLFATGVRILHALPGMIEAAEKRGREEGKKGKADEVRKESIKGDDLFKTKGSKDQGMTESQSSAESQLNLNKNQQAIYRKLVGKKAASVSVEG